MNFSALLEALNQASAFELYRLRVVIDRVLTDPKWTVAIRAQLHIGHPRSMHPPIARKLKADARSASAKPEAMR